MDRREFLKRGLMTVAGAAVGGSALSGLMGLTSCSTDPKQKRIGLQLYSLREAMGKDPVATLKLIAAMGYKELETASYGDGKLYGYAPAEFRKICEDLGMSVSSAHLGQAWDPEKEAELTAWWDLALDTQIAAGCRYAIQPWFQVGETMAEVEPYAAYFNRVGEMANSKGIKFGFHNHKDEFKVIDGVTVLDYLIKNTDPDKVLYELDVYWATKAGVSPVEYIEKYSGRFEVLHIKDQSIIGDSGEIDFEPIFNAAYANGMKDYYVEVEEYTLPPENCVEKSFQFLENAPYVK